MQVTNEHEVAHAIRDSLENQYNAYKIDTKSITHPVEFDDAVWFTIRISDEVGYEVSVRKCKLEAPDISGL